MVLDGRPLGVFVIALTEELKGVMLFLFDVGVFLFTEVDKTVI